MRKTLRILACFGALSAPLGAGAQDATPTLQRSGGASTESRLLALAQILGSLQHVRVLCNPSEGEFWRDRMMEMIRLEKPSVELKNQLTRQFNAGYQTSSERFKSCTDEARSFASDTAQQGGALAQTLADSIGGGSSNPG